eukprot:jgi/Astpho2/7509/e_gw1.00114.129.1_t
MCPSEDGQGLTYGCCPVSVVCLYRALAPGPGIQAANAGLQSLTTTGIFVISGLNLKRGEALQARGTVTVTTWLIRLFKVGANAALALLLTVGTNLLGIFTMPFVLSWTLGTGAGAVKLSPGPLLQSLIKTILLPLLCGAAARAAIPGERARTVDANKKPLSLLSAVLLCLISKAVTSGVTVRVTSLVAVVAAGAAIHLLYLAFNIAATSALRLGGSGQEAANVQRACVLVGSQKTLPIAVTVLNSLGPQLPGPVGLAVLPCVVSHLSQIVIDSFLVAHWSKQKPQPA